MNKNRLVKDRARAKHEAVEKEVRQKQDLLGAIRFRLGAGERYERLRALLRKQKIRTPHDLAEKWGAVTEQLAEDEMLGQAAIRWLEDALRTLGWQLEVVGYRLTPK